MPRPILRPWPLLAGCCSAYAQTAGAIRIAETHSVLKSTSCQRGKAGANRENPTR